jgi:hypothetical protein
MLFRIHRLSARKKVGDFGRWRAEELRRAMHTSRRQQLRLRDGRMDAAAYLHAVAVLLQRIVLLL